MRPYGNHSKILLNSQGKQRGMIPVFLKDSNYTWWHLRPRGHPPEAGQTPVGLLSCLALVWQHMAVSKLPTTPGNSSSVSKPLRVPAQESREVYDDKSPFSLSPKFHLSPCENTSSFLSTEGFYSRNLFTR